MKITLLLITFLFITSIGLSQTVSIPDPNFEQALITIGIDSDGIVNGQILESDTDGVLTMDVSASNISDLKGIEAFADLQILKCYENNLTVLDFSSNLNLKQLICNSNQIFKLIIDSNLGLKTIICDDNKLQELHLQLHPQLAELSCSNNLLTKLNVQNGNNTNFTLFDSTNNPNLVCITVDDPAYSLANWSNIDAASSFNHNCDSPETYVPDDNFENYLEANSMGNGIANDDYVSTANINTVTFLDVGYKNISDLTGIEDFIALTTLDCSDNSLASLNLIQNTLLTTLDCGLNPLTSLDVTQNLSLTHLKLLSNPIVSIDITKNLALTHLDIIRCPITSLDTSKNLALTHLDTSESSITSLDVTKNLALIDLNCFRNQLVNLDVTQNLALTDLNCYGNQLTSLNVTNNTALENLNCAYNYYITSLDVSQNSALTSLDCYTNQLTNLDVTQNTALNYLGCSSNNLTSIDITQNSALTNLNCSSNQITSLNLTQNTALSALTCSGNPLGSLNITQNPALTYLRCLNNQLTSLNTKNGNGSVFFLFQTYGNPDLTCIEVDDAVYATANLTNIDATSTFVNNQVECALLGVEDYNYANFSTFPNPATSALNVTIELEAVYRLTTMQGQIIKIGKLASGSNSINTSNLATGVYFLTVKTSEGMGLKKIVKQ